MMAYVESFARAMERARASVSYWDRKTLDHLQAAHDAEMRQCSKSEYHRGFEDSKATRDADQWQLDRERKAVAARLQAVNPSELCGSHESLSAICKAVHEPMMGWTMGACESLRNRLIYLLGGETTNSDAEISAKVVQNGEKHQLATYDVLGNERHKVVCELRKMRLDTGTAIKKLAVALGIRWNAANVQKSCAMIQSRLIHLLGGDDETASNEDGSEYGLSDRIDGSGSCMGDSMGGSEHCEDTCDCGCERLTALDNGTCPNDDVTCPNNGPTSSITDELRTWVRDHIWQHADNHTELIAIADRIDAQFERICSQQEAVLQQTISETVDEHEQEMVELRADYERATKLQREYGEKVVDLQDKLQAISVLCEQDDG